MRTQNGTSLIALLVGLLISTIVVLAMLSAYRSTIQTVAASTEGARSEGERLSGLLAAHMMMQDAGYGLVDASMNSVLVALDNSAAMAGTKLTGTALSLPANQARALVWSKGIDADNDGVMESFRCEGLLADANGALLRLSSAANCADTSTTWSLIDWTVTPLLLEARVGFEGAARALAFSVNVLATGSECQPFGIGTADADGPSGAVRVTLTYPLNANGVSQNIQASTCLVNL